MLRSCAICGADFRPDRVTQLCCSRKCYREEKRMRDLSGRLVNVPAMTFREIARRLGISHALAQLECASALREASGGGSTGGLQMTELSEKQRRCKHHGRTQVDGSGEQMCLRCGVMIRPRVYERGLTNRQRATLESSLAVLRSLNELIAWWGRLEERDYPLLRAQRVDQESLLRAKLGRIDRGDDVRQLTLFSIVLAAVVGCGSSFQRELFHDSDSEGVRSDAGRVVDAGRLRGDSAALDGPDSSGAGGVATAAGGALAAGGSRQAGGASSASGGAGGAPGLVADAGDAGSEASRDAQRVACEPYRGAVFVCAQGETTWYPCPEPPSSCHRASGTDVVCCPN